MKRRHSLPRWLIASAFFLMLVAKVSAGLLREKWDHVSEVPLADGSVLKVRQSGSTKRYFGHPHIIGFGGGDLRQKLEFSSNGKSFVWEGGSTPILLQFDGQVPVIVVFDRESKMQDWDFHYYRFDDQWKELPIKMLPRRIAIQNLWLSHHYGWVNGVELDEYEIVKKRDPADVHFQRSLMAKIWFCVATGKTYREAELEDISDKFLQDFKTSMIR